MSITDERDTSAATSDVDEQATVPQVVDDAQPDDIDENFSPRARTSAVSRRIDDELLIVEGRTGQIHVLNASAAIIWECLDGTVTVGELADELAEAFSVPSQAMLADVLTVTHDLGVRGLLEGVSIRIAALPSLETLEPGALLEPFSATTSKGDEVRLPRTGAAGTLLVNWSPYCGYCTAIAEQLAALRQPLAERDIDLVLLSIGRPEELQLQLAASGLTDLVRFRIVAGEDAHESPSAASDPFGGMGTPVAYRLDANGTVSAPCATGAVSVPRLAREAAGLPDETPELAGNQLPAATGMCGPSAGSASKPARQWAETVALVLGELNVGVRAGSPETAEVLRRAFASYLADGDVTVPANFSLVLGDEPDGSHRPGSTALNLLLVADRTVVRSRSPRRALRALAAHLSALADPVDTQLLRTTNVAGVVRGQALLMPSRTIRHIERVQPRLARSGLALNDQPEALVDPVTGDLVVPELSIAPTQAVLEELGEPPVSASELAPPCPGRYPIATWVLDDAGPDRPEGRTRASIVAGALPAVKSSADTVGEVIDQLDQAFKTLRAVTDDAVGADAFVASLEALVSAL